jgi:hypothetical protein
MRSDVERTDRLLRTLGNGESSGRFTSDVLKGNIFTFTLRTSLEGNPKPE